ncbi:hypothetical protein O181_103740 [Austropuccinia psidii MF-1]|uniref:Uncharacterized protein n=1 Tax=Austropuccinia psidii MF-1 TaxID=1389203 RepID=A0A9Q3JM62_9BASI|nr:hypothetical protein [Austropuccinia psidii MF-1]
MLKMAAYHIWIGVEAGESLPEGYQVVIGVPGKELEKRPNINAPKKTNKKHCTFEATNDSRDQGDDMINAEVDHISNKRLHTESPPILNETIPDEPLHTESPPCSMKQSMMKPLLPLLKIFKPFNNGGQLNMIQWVKI